MEALRALHRDGITAFPTAYPFANGHPHADSYPNPLSHANILPDSAADGYSYTDPHAAPNSNANGSANRDPYTCSSDGDTLKLPQMTIKCLG